MRIGMNPLRNKDAHVMGGTIIAVITHLPEVIRYHRRRLEVVKLCKTQPVSMQDGILKCLYGIMDPARN